MSYPSVSVKSRAAVLAIVTVSPSSSLCDLMDATGLSRSTVKSAIRALIFEGSLERVFGGGGRGQVSRYGVPETGQETGQVSQTKETGQTVFVVGKEGVETRSNKKGSNLVGPRAGAVSFDLEVQVLPTPVATQPPLAQTTQTILADLISAARAAGVEVPRSTIGQFASQIKRLLDEGIAPEKIKCGIEAMVARRRIIPSSLPNFVMEASLPVISGKQKPARFGRGLSVSQILEGGRLGSYAAVVAP